MNLEEDEPVDALKMVDLYRAQLDEIARAKLRGARLGGEVSRKRAAASGSDRELRELEELEKEIIELREKIIARQREMRELE